MKKITKIVCEVKLIGSLIILIFLLFFSVTGKAQEKAQELVRIELADIAPSDGNYAQGKGWTAKIVKNVLFFEAIVGDVDCGGGEDDKITSLQIQLNDVVIFSVKNSGTEENEIKGFDNSVDSCIDSDGMSWFWSQKKSGVTGSVSYKFDNNLILSVVYPLSKEFLETGNVSFTGSARDDYNDSKYQDLEKLFFTTNKLPRMPLVTAKQGCSSVLLSWNALTFSDFDKKDFVWKVYEDYNDSPLETLEGSATSCEIKNVSGVVKARLQLIWKGEVIDERSVESSSYDKIPTPVDLQASVNKCDGSVDLKWQWFQSSPSAFIIYQAIKDDGPFTALPEISGTQRSCKILDLIRGQKYYFKIAAKSKTCPNELSLTSEEVVMGMSPSIPKEPFEPTMKFLSGAQSGVVLVWYENQWSDSEFNDGSDKKYIIVRKDLKMGTETKIEIPIKDFYNEFIKDKTKGSKGFLLSYTDKEVNDCESYSYKISASNLCTTSTSVFFHEQDNITNNKISITSVDLSRVFLGKNFQASKGYYGNLVNLKWEPNENNNFVGVYKIYRRVLGSTILPELLQTLDKNARLWDDNRSVANVLYEYYIIAEADCGLKKLKSFDIENAIGQTFSQLHESTGLASEIGFRLPTATVTGKVTYVGGIAVPNVKVVVEREGVIKGTGIEFGGTNQYVKINNDGKNVNYSETGLSVSLWMKPKRLNDNQMLASLKDGFELKLEGSKVKIAIKGNELISRSDMIVDNYTHLFVTCSSDSLSLFINGRKDICIKRTNEAPLIKTSTEPIYLGSNSSNMMNYKGLIDEFRVYKTALSAEDILRDYSRLIASDSPNLVGYWRFDEGVGPYVFDSSNEVKSKLNEVNSEKVFHRLDGEIIGANWSSDVPSKVQLGFGGYTNESGDYKIEGILYNGTGENFNITPTLTLSGAVHGFAPINRVLFLGEGKTIENNIDFTDQSSFEVTGSVRFNFDDKEGVNFKSSGSEGVTIWIDGKQQCIKDGKPVLTDNFGQFKVVVPIGKHFLEFRKDKHVFQENRFPSVTKGLYDFQDRLSGIEVLDNTKHKLAGCVVGGLVQGAKKIGFLSYKGKLKPEGQRVNNIGSTYFTLTSVDTKIKRRVTTDPDTGDFEVDLPPMEYELSDVKFVGIEPNVFGDKVLFFKSELQSINLASEAAYKGVEVEDSVLVDGKYKVQKVNFNVEKRLIYRSKPTIVVLNQFGKDFLPNKARLDDAGKIIVGKTTVGEKTIKIAGKSNGSSVLIPTESLTYPLFLQGSLYQAIIKGVEKYEYYGKRLTKNPAFDFDEVPVLDGDVTVSNSISNRKDGGIVAYNETETFTGYTHQMKLLSNGSVVYSFTGGDPDFVKKIGVNDTFSKSMSITLKAGGYTVYWPEAADPSSSYKAYVLGGEKLPGTDFITEAPATVETILRMPPGSKSSITIEKGSSITKQVSSSTVGAGDFSLAMGLVVKQSTKSPLTGSEISGYDSSNVVDVKISGSNSNTSVKTAVTSFTDKFTISNEGSTFNKGDFFISQSKNNEIGLAKTIQFIQSDKCLGCLGDIVKGDDGVGYRMSTGETYYQKSLGMTNSLYSEYHIKTVIIPKLESMRNALFINQPNIYISNISADYPLYGTNNDDPRWKDDVQWDKDHKGDANGTDYRTTEEKDYSGSSYTFNREKAPVVKGIVQDMVRWYNDQIRAWNKILMDNEIEKWITIYGNQPAEKNISISSNATFTRTVMSDSQNNDVDTYDILAGATFSSKNEIRFGGVGFKIDVITGGSRKFSSSTTVGTSMPLTTSYIIKDDDPYNVFNLNIYKGLGDNGPVFQILAGQTSCPFEREKELDITKKNLYYLESKIASIPGDLANSISPINLSINDLTNELVGLNEGLKASIVFCASVGGGNPLGVPSCVAIPALKLRIDHLNSEIDKMSNEIREIEERFNFKKNSYQALLESFKTGNPLLGNRTVQIEKPGLLVNGGDKATMLNVPSSKAATFEVDLRNETELKPTQKADITQYLLAIDNKSNPDGLTILLNGQSLVQPVSFSIPFGRQVRQTLTVLRGPKKYDYKDLTLVLMSPCDTSVVKKVKMDINYIPVCAEATIVNPGNKWTVNYDSKNRLGVKINNYDVNYQGFKGIKIQYKKSNESDSDWRLLQTYYRNKESRQKAIAELKEDNADAPILVANDFIYNWDVTKLPDELYDLRIQSVCEGENEDVVFTSPVISGIIDRVNPSSFGAPQPSDGVLSAGDEIMLQFNEPINAGLLSPYNFDIRGVVQGGELRHPASLYFNGIKDYMEIPAGVQLNRRSFSVDFYAKRKRIGAETLLSQGSSTAQSFNVGFNANNQFEVTLAGIKITSQKNIVADDSWVHFAYAYDATSHEAKLYINGKLETIEQHYLPNYEAIGKISVGKDLLGLSRGFQGNMHELRFWGKTLSEAQVNIVATQRMRRNESGLLGNWRMEEAEGKLAEDIVRERHAEIISASWQAALKGNALVTSANTPAAITSPAYLEVSNFSIEFWFKGNNTTNATLLSNGRGDSQDENKNGWSIRANSLGLLEVWNNNHKFSASYTNYFDNQWHHFALVVNRLTNAVCFVDGNQQNTIESSLSGFVGFGGANLHLGEMGWIANDGTPMREQSFDGALDEVRIWQGARNASQIKRDMRYMLSGDETGLDLYLPFDEYKTTMGIELLEASSSSAASGITAVKDSGKPAFIIQKNVSYMQETPLIKLPRPVRKINFSYSANQDKIILTTEDPDSILENVSLDVSVSHAQDLNGNVMRAPVTWTAYVDKNQVNWTESDKNFQMEAGKEFTFESRIINTSGKVYNYTIKNLPVWLKANPSSGVLAPLSSMPIVFTVDRDVNIGNYTQDIHLVTEFGFAEIMNLSLDVFKPLPADWKVITSNYQYSMNFVTQLSINGDISRDPNDQVAAFVGDECRGIAKLRYVPELDNYQAYISVYSNRTSAETIQFRIWNASDGQVHREVTPFYSFESNAVKGSATKPEILKAENILEYTYDLAKGWTWISTHLNYDPKKSLKVNDLLKPLKFATNGDLIRNIDAVDSYSKADGWLGTLTDRGGVINGGGYKVFLSNAEKLKYSGLLLKGDQVNINLVKGWNWIGYVGFKKMPINQALAGYAQVKEGDVIKSQFALSIYSANIGWIGDLTYLSPGEGYMMRVGQEGSFYYPNLSYASSSKKALVNENSKETRIEASYKYPNSMNTIAEVTGDNQSVTNKLRAYVGNELRGEALPVYNPITQKQTYFMTIYGFKADEKVRFEFFDSHDDKTFLVNETVVFNADGLIGNVKKPQLLTLMSTPTQTTNVLDETILVYPNPFTNLINVKFLNGHGVKEIILFDIKGRQLIKMEIKSEQESIVLETQNLPNGLYLLDMYDYNGNILKTQRVIK